MIMKSLFRKIALASLVSMSVHAAYAWGGWEHTVVAYIAQEHLTEAAERNLRYYLDQPLTEYAEWMDFVPVQYTEKYEPLIRNTHMFTLNADGTLPDRSIVDNGECAGTHVMNMMLETVREHRNQADSTVILYLRCIIHLFGDFHCPSHILANDAPGGMMPDGSWRNHFMFRKCWYEGKKVTMHNMWDTALQREKPDWTFEDWRIFLDTYTQEQIEQVTAGGFSEWLIDSNSSIEHIYEWWKPDQKYDRTWYDEKVTALAHSQIRKAAYRMAEYLNQVFDYE